MSLPRANLMAGLCLKNQKLKIITNYKLLYNANVQTAQQTKFHLSSPNEAIFIFLGSKNTFCYPSIVPLLLLQRAQKSIPNFSCSLLLVKEYTSSGLAVAGTLMTLPCCS